MTYETRKQNKLNRILRQNTKTQVAVIERAEKKAAKQSNAPISKVYKWLLGISIAALVVFMIFGGANQGSSTSTPSTSTTPAEGVTGNAASTSCAQWRSMSASDRSTMAASIISSEQAGGQAKGMSSTWLAANVTASCGGTSPSIPAGVSNSTVGQMATLIIYDVTVNPHAESDAASANAEAEEGGG